jgi:hypothetical protein
MGPEGAAYADTLVKALEKAGGASTEKGQEIINNFLGLAEGVDESQSKLSGSLTDITGTLEEKTAEWEKTVEEAAKNMNVSDEAMASGVATVQAYIDGLDSGEGGLDTVIAKITGKVKAGLTPGAGGNSAGGNIPEHANGADYIPYDNYLAYLHKGEMVIPAKISDELRDFLGSNGGGASAPITPAASGNSGALDAILDILEQIARNGLNANFNRAQLYRSVNEENRIRTRSTNYNPLGAMA